MAPSSGAVSTYRLVQKRRQSAGLFNGFAMSQVIEQDSTTSAETIRSVTQNSQNSATTLFPLPLTPFERYMVEDDRDEYPMTFAFVVELNGLIDRASMEAAVAAACQRHPLTTARLSRQGRVDRWVAGPECEKPVEWREGPVQRQPFGGARVDLRSEPGLRVEGYQQDEASCLVFSFHHAMADGLGALQFVGDALALYGIDTQSSGAVPQLAPLDSERLKTRGYFDIQLPHPVSRWTALRSLIVEGWRIVSRRPGVLRSAAGRQNSQEPHAGYVTTTLEPDELESVRREATRVGATLNQCLVSQLFLALHTWQTEHARRPAKWLRVTVPTSLRARADRATPATNILGYLMVTRHQRQCSDRAALLESVAAELDFALQWAMGALFPTAISQLDRVAGLLGFLTRRSKRFSTAVLSNLGEATRRFTARFPRQEGKVVVGNLILENITAAPPVRPGTSIAIAVTGCAGKLSFCAQYDPKQMTEEDVREFLELYLSLVKGENTTSCDSGETV